VTGGSTAVKDGSIYMNLNKDFLETVFTKNGDSDVKVFKP
jgi:hypothetical protein